MKKRLATLAERVRNSHRIYKYMSWVKGILSSNSKMERPLTHIIQGGPVLRGAVALIVLILVVGISWLGADGFAHNRSQRITMFSAAASLFLTSGLIWVYLSIAESERTQALFVEKQTELQNEIQSLQENQVKIQEDQVEIMAAEFEPVIEVHDFGSGNDKPPTNHLPSDNSPPHKGDFFRIKISNLSDAIATNLQVRFLIDYIGPNYLITEADVPLTRVGSDRTWTSKPGGIIQGRESEIEYHCIAGMKLPSRSRNKILPFTTCLQYLFENDISRARFGLALVYEDRKGTEHVIDLEGFEFTESDQPHVSPSLARMRNLSDDFPISLIKEEFLREGITAIPPPFAK